MSKDKDEIETIEDSIEDESLLYGARSNISLEREVTRTVEEIFRLYREILVAEESGSTIVEAKGHKLNFQYTDGTQKEKEISEYISRLKQLVPSLRTMGTDDKEIDDFISEVRMSGISKITDKIKIYQRNVEQHQEIDWGDEKISGGEEYDWN